MLNVSLRPILMTLLLCLFWSVRTALGLDDHRAVVKIDKEIKIVPAGTLTRAMMRMVRHPDGAILLNTQTGPIYKSTDNGQTWMPVPVKLPDAPPKQMLHGLGVSGDGRLWLMHQSPGGEDLFASVSKDGGQTWATTRIDFTKVPTSEPERPYNRCWVDSADFIERPDGTMMFGAGLRRDTPYYKDPKKLDLATGLVRQDADVGGYFMFRSTGGGKTWDNATLAHPYMCEVDHAVDPNSPNHILSMTRIQRPLLAGEDREAVYKKTGCPANSPPSEPSIYKNGVLLESTNGGRSFHEAEGGVADWYGHRGTICWARNDVVAVAHNHGGSGNSRRVARISLDGGNTWVDGTKAGTPFMNKSTKFLLNGIVGFTSPTIELSEDHFLTAMYHYSHLPGVPEEFKDVVGGVFWHLERITKK